MIWQEIDNKGISKVSYSPVKVLLIITEFYYRTQLQILEVKSQKRLKKKKSFSLLCDGAVFKILTQNQGHTEIFLVFEISAAGEITIKKNFEVSQCVHSPDTKAFIWTLMPLLVLRRNLLHKW